MDSKQSDKLGRLLDYEFRLDGGSERDKTEELLRGDAEAQRIHAALRQSLQALSRLEDVAPPAGLADRTLELIAQHQQARTMAQASQAIAAQRQAPQEPQRGRDSRGRWLLGNMRDLIAMAASILIIVFVSQPGLHYARQQAQQVACAAQLREAGSAFSQYAGDNWGMLPYVHRQPGDQWTVGSHGSNTRNAFLLVKNNYIEPKDFVCPAAPGRTEVRVRFDPQTLRAMVDFRTPREISYSTRLLPPGETLNLEKMRLGPLAADQNPVFVDFDGRRQLVLDRGHKLLQANSPNHTGRGQNVLFTDGHVQFVKNRRVGPGEDDIFTINRIMRYHGHEAPANEKDVFIAP